jgi:hypothetical protein
MPVEADVDFAKFRGKSGGTRKRPNESNLFVWLLQRSNIRVVISGCGDDAA